MAMQINGCSGQFHNLSLNTVYEPATTKFNNKPCWVARSSTPLYIFHTKKTRWVIGRQMDDGSRCYAFVEDKDNGDAPAETGWKIGSTDPPWAEDPRMRCVSVKASEDHFVKLRLALEDDMKRYGLVEANSLAALWKKMDRDGNGEIELSEMEALVIEMVKSGVWPDFMNQKDALELAFKTTLADSEDGDAQLEQEEFHDLLLNMFWFCKLHDDFRDIDNSNDGTLDASEFAKGMEKLGIHMTSEELRREIAQIDCDGSGTCDFGEFCKYVRDRVHPEHNTSWDSDKANAQKTTESMRKKQGDSTNGVMTRKKNFADFDALEKKIKALCADDGNKGVAKLWKRLDFNGNNLVSLAEIDKWVVENYPLLNHKPALIRAQQATLEEGGGEEYIHKKDFKRLLANLFYFNKLFWLFDQTDGDHDRRMDFKEFQWCVTMCGEKMSERKAQSEFKKIDTNGGGIILFDEFCKYFTQKQCPQGLAEFIADE